MINTTLNKTHFTQLADGTVICYIDSFGTKEGQNIIFPDGEILSIDEIFDEDGDPYDICYQPICVDGIYLHQDELDLDADYFTVQFEIDGFGNDSMIVFSSNNIHECVEFLENNGDKYCSTRYAIVGQYFNQKFHIAF